MRGRNRNRNSRDVCGVREGRSYSAEIFRDDLGAYKPMMGPRWLQARMDGCIVEEATTYMGNAAFASRAEQSSTVDASAW